MMKLFELGHGSVTVKMHFVYCKGDFNIIFTIHCFYIKMVLHSGYCWVCVLTHIPVRNQEHYENYCLVSKQGLVSQWSENLCWLGILGIVGCLRLRLDLELWPGMCLFSVNYVAYFNRVAQIVRTPDLIASTVMDMKQERIYIINIKYY